MQHTRILLPKMQLITEFVQDAEDAVYIGSARSIAIQVFADDWQGTLGSGGIDVSIQMASSPREDQFIASPMALVLAESTGLSTGMMTQNIDQLAPYIRVSALATSAGPGVSVNFWAQINIRGPR